MKHRTKQALSWLLSFALMLSLIPNMALTAYAASSSGTIGSATYTISDAGVLTVGSGEFTIDNWKSVFGTGGTSNTPNDTAKSIKSVVFQEGAVLTSTSMKNMFRKWTALESADLANLTASNVTEMRFTFGECASLTSVTFGAGVETSNVNTMESMFYGCSSLTDLDLSTFKAYAGTGSRSLYQTFRDCSKLVTIRVSDDWNVTNTGGDNTFSGCSKLEGGNGTKANGSGDYTKAIIDGKDGQKGYFTSASAPVEHRHDFTYSPSGSTLTATCSADDCGLTDHKVEMTLTSPAKTVYGDSNSAAATLEGREAFNEATGLNIGSSQYYVYYKKGSDTPLGSAPTTPGKYTVKVTISNVAGSSYTLTEDYTIAQKEIGLTWADTTFHYDGKSHVPTATATGLVGSDKCDVTVIGEQTAIGTYTATASDLSNEWYKLPENTTTEFAIEGWVGTARYTIEEAPSPKKLFAAKSISHDITNGVLTIYGGEFNNADWKTAFANDDFITNTRDNITSVKFVKENDKNTAAKLTDSAQGMFKNWSKLESIDFTNLDTSDVTWMGTMFSGCSSLTELDLSPLDTKKVTNMDNMFYKCSKLGKITVGENWKTASSTSHMFSGCNELAGNAGTTYQALFGNYIETDGSTSNPFLPDVDGKYAHVDKGTIDPGFFYNVHEHHLTYSVDPSKPWKITATCNADGCYLGDSSSHSVSISLVKPTLYVYWMDELNKKDGEYDKGASPLATLTMQNVGDQTLKDSTTVADPDGKINGVSFSVATFNDANTAAPTFKELTGATIGEIEYYEKGSDTKLAKAPTDAGTYTAKVTIGDATASVDYRIFKRFHSPVLKSPVKNESYDFSATEAQNLITVEEGAIQKVDNTDTSTFEYALGTNATAIPKEGWSKTIPTGTGTGPFYVFYRVAGDDNHGDAMESEFPNKSGYADSEKNYKPAYSVIVISKEFTDPPTGKKLTYNTTEQELVNAGTAASGSTMQYAIGQDAETAPTDGWKEEVPKGTDAGDYYVWYKTVTTADSSSSTPICIKVTIDKVYPTANAPTELTATYGQTLNDVALTNPTGNTDGNWQWVDETTTSVGDLGEHHFLAKFTPTDTVNYHSDLQALVTVTVGKANNPLTYAETQTVNKTFSTASQTETLTAAENAQGTLTYAITSQKKGDDTVKHFSLNGTTLTLAANTSAGTYTVVVRATATGDNNYNSGTKDSTVTVTVGKADNPLTYAATQTVNKTFSTASQTETLTAAENAQGTLTYAITSQKKGDDTVEHFSLDGTTLTLAANTPAGTYTVVVTATAAGDDNYNGGTKDSTVTVTVGKAAATVTPVPTAIPGLTYTDEEQALVNAGTASGGRMQYVLGTDGTTAPETGFADAIPRGKNAGTYYVWYKAAGDDNHSDSEPVCVTVTIAKATMNPAPTLRLVTVTKGQDGAQDTYTDKAEWIYGDTSVVPLVVNNASGGVVTTIYTVNDTEQTEMPTDAGSYSAKAKIAATANYNAIETNSVSFTITKAPHSNMTAAQTVSVSRSGATGATLNLSEYLANATSWAVQSTDGTLITSATKGDGAVLTYTAAQTTAASATGNVVLTVTTKNYADYTLTVNFRTAAAFTLRFESNGGTEVPSRILNENAAYGTMPVLTRNGYTFDGWFTNAACTQPATAETSIGHADATVYAKWTAITRTITLNLNGHSSAPAGYTEDNGAYKKTYSVTGEDFALPVLEDEKSGEATTYSFGGWQKDGTGTAQINVTIRVSDGEDATYTALWVEGKKEGEVTFEKGTSDTKLLGLESMDEGTVSTENADTTVDNKGAGKSLAEVMKEVACDTSVTGGTSAQTVAVDMKIQPTDQENEKFAIGSTGAGESVQNDYLNIDIKQTVTDANDVKTTSSIADIKRVVEIPLQYDLTGLYQPKIYRSHNSEVNEFTRLASKPTSDFRDATFYVSGSGAGAVIYVYTRYFSTYAVSTTSIPTHTVMFDSNGGTAVASQSVAENGNVSKPASDPTKASGSDSIAYVFAGWYPTNDFSGTAYDFENTAVTQDMTLYAKWREVVIYTITFNPNGGTVTPTSAKTDENGKVSLPTPTQSGYRFDGWYDALTEGNMITAETVFTADAEVYARWTKNSSGGSSSSSTITVPVSGDSASVSVSASVSGTTATIKAPTTAELNKVIGESVHTGDVTIDVSGLNKDIATVSIPTETVKAIEKAVSDPDNDADALKVKLTDGSVTFDAAALAAIAQQAKGSTIQLNLDSVGESELKSAQKTAIKDMDVQAVYDAYMTSNGQRISDFKGGKAAVTVSYTLKDGQTGRGVVVWYVADDGKTTEVPTAYNDKTVSFTVEHFSNYVFAYDAQRAAVCPKDDTCPISAFSDASATAWYHDGVHYVLESGIMNGVGNGKFGPGNATSRAMIAQILWNMEGNPVVNYAMSYTDVDTDAWYAEAVRWATAQGIMAGYGYNKFGPNDDMTREQLVTIMYRYAQMKKVDVSIGEDTNILSYDDAFDVSEWAIPAMQWAVGAEIVNGTSASTLSPKNNASRAEIATIVMRYCEKNAK